MWEIVVEFEQEETVTCCGEEEEIPLMVAMRYYQLFVKEAEAIATYRDSKQVESVSLEEKIKEIVGKEKL